MTSRLPWCGFRPPRNDPGQNRCRITTQTKATDTVMAQVFSGGSGNPFAGALTLYGRPSTAPARKRPPCQRGHRHGVIKIPSSSHSPCIASTRQRSTS